MKKLLIMSLILLLSINLAFAHEHDFAGTKQLIDSGIGCDELSDEQLNDIGDYYMEQMHPGEAHEMMDNMMGGEGSESLKQMHIQMAKRLYCNEDVGGMMESGNMMSSGGMMGMMSFRGMAGSSTGGSLWWLFSWCSMVRRRQRNFLVEYASKC